METSEWRYLNIKVRYCYVKVRVCSLSLQNIILCAMGRTLILALSVVLSACSSVRQHIDVVPYPNEVSFRSGMYELSDIDDLVYIRNDSLSEEAYIIDITRKGVRVEASGQRGFNYAVQTLKQMGSKLPCCRIEDAPRFSYRGLHLDEARHFFGKDFVKKYLDIMAFHKLNTFHWHLTDDQGWRIEIKKYPELTQIGSVRNGTCIKRNYNTNDGIPYGEGMWYSQEDIKEIVAYAAERGIDIIPEIDLPGHMLAALAAYPHLGCSGGPYSVWHRWGVSNDVLCVGNPQVYDFLEDVLDEVCELFPCEYIHIGGDECPKTSWEACPDCQALIKRLDLKDDDEHSAEHYLQSYVMNRMEDYLKTKGRRVIGWDEILEGSPSQSATVMSWRGEAGGLKAARLGHDVIMTPNSYCYWDYYQATDIENEPFAIGGYVPVELMYSYEPYPKDMSAKEQAHILGVQANMWTEYISDAEHLEYMLLPRLAALSEVQWCQPENKDWERFLGSIDEICAHYAQMGYKYAEHVFGVSGYVEADQENNCARVTLQTQDDAQIRYTLDGTDPDMESMLYEGPLEISSTCILKASAVRDGSLTRPYRQSFSFHKAVGKEIILIYPSQSEHSSNTGKELLDGIRGPAIHKSKEWSAWKAHPFEAVIDMELPQLFSRVEIGYISNKPSQIFNPVSLSVLVSEDGATWNDVASIVAQPEGEFDSDGLKSMSLEFTEVSARYLKIKADCLANVPAWHHYPGRQAWLYIDEVIVN